jgi:hypothetical protein
MATEKVSRKAAKASKAFSNFILENAYTYAMVQTN